NGSLTITDKQTNRTYEQIGVYENTGDIGNEYMYKQPQNEKALTTENIPARIELAEDTPFRAAFDIVHEWSIPKSATDLLEQEQREVVEFTRRKAQRTDEMVPFVIKTRVMLEKSGKGVHVEATFNNQAKDHLLRVLFPTYIKTDEHYVDSIFEVAKRPNESSEEWTNTDNSQQQQDYVSLCNIKEKIKIVYVVIYEYVMVLDGSN